MANTRTKCLPVPPGYLVVSREIGEIIDQMEARGFENCTFTELAAVILHAASRNPGYRPQLLDDLTAEELRALEDFLPRRRRVAGVKEALFREAAAAREEREWEDRAWRRVCGRW